MNFILPNQFVSYECNLVLMNEFKTSIMFNGVAGSIPFHILNGEINHNDIKQFYGIPVIKDCIAQYTSLGLHSFFLYCNNDLIEETDFKDIMSINLYELFSISSFNNYYIITSNENLIKFLLDNYPRVKVIYQVKDKILDYPNIKGVEISLDNLELINSINQREDFLIIGKLPLLYCNSCANYKNCNANESSSILNFSQISYKDNCLRKQFQSLESLKDYYDNNKDKVTLMSFEEIPISENFTGYKLIEDFFTLLSKDGR